MGHGIKGACRSAVEYGLLSDLDIATMAVDSDRERSVTPGGIRNPHLHRLDEWPSIMVVWVVEPRSDEWLNG